MQVLSAIKNIEFFDAVYAFSAGSIAKMYHGMTGRRGEGKRNDNSEGVIDPVASVEKNCSLVTDT